MNTRQVRVAGSGRGCRSTPLSTTEPVTAADVKRVAIKYLTKGRVVLSIVPMGKPDLAAKPGESTKVPPISGAGVK